MKAILFDLDGVLYVGNEAIGGASDTLAWLHASAIPHLFVTNTTSRPRRAIVEKLSRMGIEVEAENILTPAVAAADWLNQNVEKPVALFIPEATRQEFSAFPELPTDVVSGAGAVVIGDMGYQWDFALLNRAFRLLMEEPPPAFIALGMTRYWRSDEGLQLDTGPFVRALEYATGQTALVMGKPAADFYLAAAARLGLSPEELLMIGDDIQGDIGGAQSCGMKTALVRTGKFREGDLNGEVVPDEVFASIADLPQWWEGH